MRNLVIGLAVLSFSCTGFAAKAHREAQKEMAPKIKEATKAVQDACGVAPKINVDWKSFNTVKADKVREFKSNIEHELTYIGEQSKAFCSDADSKALFKKNTKVITVSVTEKGDPVTTYSKGTFNIATTSQMNSGGYKFKSILDEW